MEQQAPQEFILEAFADPSSVRDVVRGILHTIFFHRFFPSLSPNAREVLDLSLPYVEDAELDTMIEKRAGELSRDLDATRTTHPSSTTPTSSSSRPGSSSNSDRNHHYRTQTHPAAIVPSSSSSFSSANPAAAAAGITGTSGNAPGSTPTGGGRGTMSVSFFEKKRRKAWYMRAAGDEEVCWERWTIKVTVAEPRTDGERAKVRKAMEHTLLTAVMKIVTCVNTHRDHIPPITTSEANPFPYQITVNQKDAGWATRMGIY
ncbi:autophagy-related protein [Microdochium trichocladiopsis]|uniref:Autophagy-related protein 101 n=1 Tax=Microdochium trichocladiopsis TaxID=1682393 RepID=A0A9P8YE45_9PEZI|nr:autophagy-related protein [Microdochium trichocladiopsis]KAH7037653.1 autophagy-related protein [Microdochium trichocladiopsis]